MALENVTTAGGHGIRFEAPDVMYLDWRGTLNAEDIEALATFTTNARELAGVALFLIVDAHSSGGISGAARKSITNLARRKYWHATICHGADFKLRVLIELIVNAVNLLVKEGLPLVFVDTDKAAREWVQSHRGANSA
jgi:hypothetical protein